MSGHTQHHITHRMVPLICQALITAPQDQVIWTEGLRMLANPKLKPALGLTSSIWLPLMLKGLDLSRPSSVISAALLLVCHAADILQPMKSCLVKPLKALDKKKEDLIMGSELDEAFIKLELDLEDAYGLFTRDKAAPATTVLPGSTNQHPILSEILAHNLASRTRTIRQAWSQTLLASPHDNPQLWLHNLYQATLESCQVPELIVAARLGNLFNRGLFQTAFMKCYSDLENDQGFREVVNSTLVKILRDHDLSKKVHTTLLELIAFFNKDKQQLSPLVHQAATCCALTHYQGGLNKALPGIALWYMEQEAESIPTEANVANLIEANIRIGAIGHDAAFSTAQWLEQDWQSEPEPKWITQLSHWKQALKAQDKIDASQDGMNYNSFNTRMICYHALGDFQTGYELALSLFEGLSDEERTATSHWAIAAAWQMGDFETMGDYLPFHPKGTSKSLYKAVIDVHNGQYASAFHHINKAQSLSYDEVQLQLTNNSQNAFKSLAKTEFLVELQEVIQYKTHPEMRDNILDTRATRFENSHADPNTWLKRLQIWTLACLPTTHKLQKSFLDTAKLCVHSGMYKPAEAILEKIAPSVEVPGCKVAYTKLRFNWQAAHKAQDTSAMQAIYSQLAEHTWAYLDHVKLNREDLEAQSLGMQSLRIEPASKQPLSKEIYRLVSRNYYRMAEWLAVLEGNLWVFNRDTEVMKYTSLALKLDTEWYAGALALAERSLAVFEHNSYSNANDAAVSDYILPALKGLFIAIRAHENPEFIIKALLKLIPLWFRFGDNQAVLDLVKAQLALTPVEPWLSALPQLIARLGTPDADLRHTLISLLKSITSQYPHAVIWPLLTATQTRKTEHQEGAKGIMGFICSMPDGSRLVEQAELVGKELIRTSSSSLERWRALIDHAIPRQDLMDTAWEEIPHLWAEEIARLQVYSDLYKMYGEIDYQLNQWKQPGAVLHLANTAPRLLSLRDCILTVPGKYNPQRKLDDQVFIDGFHQTVNILSSKQLPRKVVIRSYSADYTFLLKGNEDLRGDERIMQLFKLINTILNHNSDAFSRNLHLLPYQVIPLSPSAGLVSWVPNTQQFQSIIQDNRAKNEESGLNDMEIASLMGHNPAIFTLKQPKFDVQGEMDKYDKLPVETKVKRLQAALSHSKQNDLKDVLWQKSPSSDIWIKRRTNFARTVGVSSFVGHVIGLGDRHGSNILIDQLSWGALHIDFGDLFGVAQERSFLPEKVPFRLTRMMTNSFELAARAGLDVPGSRGTFKQASLIVMSVLRDSRSTILAMLEAFLYDPLLSWTSSRFGGVYSLLRIDHTDLIIQGLEEISLAEPHDLNRADKGARSNPKEDRGQAENFLITKYLETDSFLGRVGEAGMTNSKALKVLSDIERKLIGYSKNSDQPLSVKKQVQELIEEATDLKNLSQGYVLGWIPQW
ncbi:hypothetical protein IAU60_000307 [Kwoniella sp. DSM 27419]